MANNESVTATRKYHGYVVKTITQDSGRKTYDIETLTGKPVEGGIEYLSVAKATVDAYVESVTPTFQYHGYVLRAVAQDSDQKTYDIETLTGELVKGGIEYLSVAKATVDIFR